MTILERRHCSLNAYLFIRARTQSANRNENKIVCLEFQRRQWNVEMILNLLHSFENVIFEQAHMYNANVFLDEITKMSARTSKQAAVKMNVINAVY